MQKKYHSHYDWLEANFEKFFNLLNCKCYGGEVTAHGDKCYSYQDRWEKANIPFAHGVAIYLLSYNLPYSKQVRETKHGWVNPCDWVISTYPEFKLFLKELEPVDLIEK